MGRLRLTAPRRARLLVAISGGCVAAGVWQQFGQAWGLIVGGGLGIAYGLLMVDVDEEA